VSSRTFRLLAGMWPVCTYYKARVPPLFMLYAISVKTARRYKLPANDAVASNSAQGLCPDEAGRAGRREDAIPPGGGPRVDAKLGRVRVYGKPQPRAVPRPHPVRPRHAEDVRLAGQASGLGLGWVE
jgi:hypothetical protein